MLLALDLLAILGVSVIVLLVLQAARKRAVRRAGKQPKALQSVEPRFQHWEPEDFQPVAERGTAANVSMPVTIWKEAVDEPARPVSAKKQPAVVGNSATMQMVERNYTDPIDGMLFEPGEPVIACPCGLGYRAESVRWLHQHCSGRCAQCNAKLPAVDEDR